MKVRLYPEVTFDGEFEPAVVAPPAKLKRGYDYVKTQVMPATSYNADGLPYLASDPVTVEAKAARGRILVDGVDVTYFRGVKTPFPGYLLTDPFEYGATSIEFPQVSLALESNSLPSWARFHAEVQIHRVDPDAHEVVGRDYRGVVTAVETDGANLVLEVGGELSGRAAPRLKQKPLFRQTKDLGIWAYDGLRVLGLRLTPYLGPNTGINLLGTGGMSQLDWLNRLCAMSSKKDGTQRTIMTVPGNPRAWEFREKDKTTIHATVYFDDARIVPNLKRDIYEEPARWYGTGTNPDGLIIQNDVYPGAIQGPTPPFPGTLHPGDIGDAVDAMIWRLIGMGYLSRTAAPGGYDDDVSDAIEALQDSANLPQTGVMDSATWNALYDLSVTGYSIQQATILPMVQKSWAKDWYRTATGVKIRRNPKFKARNVIVERQVDFGGGVREQQMRKWLQQDMNRSSDSNWVGEIKWNGYGLIRGEHNPGDPAPTSADVVDMREVRGGWNIWAPRWDGGTLFHVAGSQLDAEQENSPRSGTLTVDTQFRDMLEVSEIIQRNRDSRFDPARAFLAQRRSTNGYDSFSPFSKAGGFVYDKVALSGNAWNVFPVFAGQEGTIRNIAIQMNPACESAVALFGRSIRGERLQGLVGNPFDTNGHVTSVHLSDGGSGYTAAPNVTLSGGGGSGAHAVASIGGGKVVSVTVTNGGSGYTDTPSVSFNDPTGESGSGASATARVSKTGADRWSDSQVRKALDDRVLLAAWGTSDQPCGYEPGKKTDDNNKPTGDPITGLFRDAAGVSYVTFAEPVIYVAVYPLADCSIDRGRIMWPQLTQGQ